MNGIDRAVSQAVSRSDRWVRVDAYVPLRVNVPVVVVIPVHLSLHAEILTRPRPRPRHTHPSNPSGPAAFFRGDASTRHARVRAPVPAQFQLPPMRPSAIGQTEVT